MSLKQVMQAICLLLVLCYLTACDDGNYFAPVTEINNIAPIPKSGVHRVVNGETLYEIAWQYGLDYRDLAVINHISPPYAIHVGQVLLLRRSAAHYPVATPITVAPSRIKRESIATSMVASPSSAQPMTYPSYLTWTWPAKGSIIKSFSSTHKGLNIHGEFGAPIYAAAAGNVVYSGNGLRGYGNLIILKHNGLYLSAYADNSLVYVKEGDWVKKGQKIAEMGRSDSGVVMLHFEIRRAGKPINPILILNPK